MEISGDTQVLRGLGGTISVTVTDSPAPAFGTATVTITGYDGTALVTDAAASGTNGAYTYRLTTANTAALDILTAAWSFTVDGTIETVTTRVEVIGAWLFSIADARAFDAKQLADTTKWPDAVIAAARGRILDTFQDICSVAFVPRYAEEFTRNDGGHSPGDAGGWWAWSVVNRPEVYTANPYPTKLRELAVSYWANDWAVMDLTTLGPIEYVPEGLIRGYFPHGYLRLRYEHGYTEAPAAIRKAALQVLLFELIPSNLPERATSYDVNGSNYRLSTADGIRRFYGIPTVDATLQRYAFVNIG